MTEPLDKPLLMQPAQMPQRRCHRHIGGDAHAFDRNLPPFAVGDVKVEQHIPGWLGKQAAGEMARTQPPLTIQSPRCFEKKIGRNRVSGHVPIQLLAARRGRVSPRLPRLAERSSGPGTSHKPSGRMSSKGERPMPITLFEGGTSASIST